MSSWCWILICIITSSSSSSSLDDPMEFVIPSYRHHRRKQIKSEHFQGDKTTSNEIKNSPFYDGGTIDDFLQNFGPISTRVSSSIDIKPKENSRVKLNKNVLNEIQGVNPKKLKTKLYSLLKTLKNNPQGAIQALLTGEVPHKYLEKAENKSDSEWKITYERKVENKDTLYYPVTRLREPRTRRENPAVMYLPINQQQMDPCAAPKGSKLMEALPLVFLSTVLSVADAVGNIINNINSNNKNNNNNNDNNINNDNTNLAANINNANQINIVPFGGRALRIARAIMDSIGRMAMGFYETIMPSSGEKHSEETNTSNKTTQLSSHNTTLDDL